MMPLALVQQIEIAFIKRAALLVERGKIDLKKAKEFATELMALLPFVSLDDLKQKIKAYALRNPLFENLPLTIHQYEDNRNAHATAQQMTELIKSDKHEEAISLAK